MPPGVEAGITGTQFFRAIKNYWTQSRFNIDSEVCSLIRNISSDTLTDAEKDIACKTKVRDPPQLIDLDLVEYTKSTIQKHNYKEGPLFHMHSTQMM